MAAENRHPDDDIQLLLDGRLDPARRGDVEAHLSVCASCRRRRDALSETRRITRASGSRAVPPGLETRLRAALDAEDTARRGRASRRRWVAAIVTATAVVVFGAPALWHLAHRADVVAIAADDFASVRAGTMPIEVRTDQPARLAAHFAAHGAPSKVFDFGMMGFRLEGGAVRQIGGHPSALYVYGGPGGLRLVCQMFRGRADELPPGSELRERNGVVFRIFERNGVTLVFWQEGDIMCVLASDLAREQLVDLAVAKSMKS